MMFEDLSFFGRPAAATIGRIPGQYLAATNGAQSVLIYMGPGQTKVVSTAVGVGEIADAVALFEGIIAGFETQTTRPDWTKPGASLNMSRADVENLISGGNGTALDKALAVASLGQSATASAGLAGVKLHQGMPIRNRSLREAEVSDLDCGNQTKAAEERGAAMDAANSGDWGAVDAYLLKHGTRPENVQGARLDFAQKANKRREAVDNAEYQKVRNIPVADPEKDNELRMKLSEQPGHRVELKSVSTPAPGTTPKSDSVNPPTNPSKVHDSAPGVSITIEHDWFGK